MSSDRRSQIEAWIHGDLPKIKISLTGPDSHTLYKEPGLGSQMIGPKAFHKGKTDLAVDVDAKIRWSEFTPFTTPAGSPWPRWLHYMGNDIGVFDWMKERETESLDWTPTRAVTVDARHANISTLKLNLTRGVKVKIVIPSCLREISIVGDISLLDAVFEQSEACKLILSPSTKSGSNSGSLAYVPELPAFSEVRSVCLCNEPCRQPIDAASILQFSKITRLELYGEVQHLEVLKAFQALEELALRYMSDLSGLPSLSQWPKLQRLIAYNIEEDAGKALRIESRSLKKAAAKEGCEVLISKLRKLAWFKDEYGLPFSGWSKTNARAATKAYRQAEAAMPQASNCQEVLTLLRTFGAALNKLAGLETPEREDAAVAFSQLLALSKFDIAEETLSTCFSEVCDF